jgi:hypothetical protein
VKYQKDLSIQRTSLNHHKGSAAFMLLHGLSLIGHYIFRLARTEVLPYTLLPRSKARTSLSCRALLVTELDCPLPTPGSIHHTSGTQLSVTASCHLRPDGRRSDLRDSIRKKQNLKASDRQCSYLKDSPSCLALANQIRSTPQEAIANLADCSV